MAAHGGAAAPEHLVDDAPSEAASWTQRVKKKTHNVADLLNKLKASKAVRKEYRAMVDLKRLETTLDTVYEETRLEKDAELKEMLQAGVGVMLCTDGWRHRRAGNSLATA
ncbi:hypothetical protein V8C86DRAFT_3120659 [Haematococcus lacustris]